MYVQGVAKEMPNATLAMFSTLKYVNAPNFEKFRETWNAKYLGGFIVHSKAFDGLDGNFPIGFLVWKTEINAKTKTPITEITTEILSKKVQAIGEKKFYNLPNSAFLNVWMEKSKTNKEVALPLPSIEAKDEGVSEITKLRADLLNMPASNDPYLTVLSFDSIVYLTTKLEKTPSELGKLELIDRKKYASTLLKYSKEFLEYYANGMLEKRAEMLKEVHTDDADSSLKVERMAIRRYPENFLYAFESKMLPMKDLQKYQKQLASICDGMKLNYPMPQSQNVVQECISQMNRLHSAAGAN